MPVLGDLVFHATEIELWKATGGDDAGNTLLASVYAYHARWLSEFGRNAEATTFARRALRQADKRSLSQENWLSAAVMLARSEARQGHLDAAIGLIREYLPQATTPSYQAWLGSEMARLRIDSGDAASALRLSRHVAQLAQDQTPAVEFWFRRYDHAEILLRTGHPAQALEWLPIHQDEPGTRNLTAPLLLTARTLLALGSVVEAQPYLQEAQAQADRYGLTHLHPEIEMLARQCKIAP